MNPNQRLKELRSRLGITTREVADLSQKIADAEGNAEFYISNPWLTQVENSDSVPSIHKLYSLGAIYRIKITDLFLLFGIDLARLHEHQLHSPLARTHLTTLDIPDEKQTVQFPVRFDPSFDLRHTNLLSRMVQVWGQIPIAFLKGLDIRQNMYGYIGLEDYMLFPILRPGSFVQIDPRVRKILPGRWRSGVRPPDLLCRIARWVLLRVVRNGSSLSSLASSPALSREDPPADLRRRWRDYRPGHRRSDPPDGCRQRA